MRVLKPPAPLTWQPHERAVFLAGSIGRCRAPGQAHPDQPRSTRSAWTQARDDALGEIVPV